MGNTLPISLDSALLRQLGAILPQRPVGRMAATFVGVQQYHRAGAQRGECWRKEAPEGGLRKTARELLGAADRDVRQQIKSSLAGHGPWIVKVASGCMTFTPRGCAISRKVEYRCVARPKMRKPGQRRRREHRSRATETGSDGDGEGDGDDFEEGDVGGAVDCTHRQQLSTPVVASGTFSRIELGQTVRAAPRSPRSRRYGDVATLRLWRAWRAAVAVAWSGIGVGG